MSLFYQIVFPRNAPAAETLVQRQVADWANGYQMKEESAAQLVVLHQGELVVSLVVTNQNNYLELSFGDYSYDTDWYIELGKTNGLTAMRFYMELLGRVLNTYDGDFLSIFNGERVVAKREDGRVYLNTESSIWRSAENLSILANHAYELVSYPVE